MPTKKQTHVRNTITGRYTTKEEARKYPATTVVETDKVKPKRKSNPKKK
jgi:hypothetical protein